MLIGVHVTNQEFEKVEQLKVLFGRRTNSDLLRFLIANGEKILGAIVSIDTTPAPVPVRPVPKDGACNED